MRMIRSLMLKIGDGVYDEPMIKDVEEETVMSKLNAMSTHDEFLFF